MGTSSSQPVPDPTNSTTIHRTRTAVEVYNPEEDDLAASQQLLEEAIRATPRASKSVRTGNAPTNGTMSRLKDAKTLYLTDSARSTRFPPFRLYSPEVPKDDDSASSHSPLPSPKAADAKSTRVSPHHIEVPDSQAELPPPPPTQAPMSPPWTSSIAMPESTKKKAKKTYKKSRRSMLAESGHDITDEQDNVDGSADAEGGATETFTPQPSPSRAQRKRKRKKGQSAVGEAESEAPTETITSVKRPVGSTADTETLATNTKQPRKPRNPTSRKNAPSDPVEDDGVTHTEAPQATRSRRQARKGKKHNSGASSMQGRIPTPPDERADDEPVASDVALQTQNDGAPSSQDSVATPEGNAMDPATVEDETVDQSLHDGIPSSQDNVPCPRGGALDIEPTADDIVQQTSNAEDIPSEDSVPSDEDDQAEPSPNDDDIVQQNSDAESVPPQDIFSTPSRGPVHSEAPDEETVQKAADADTPKTGKLVKPSPATRLRYGKGRLDLSPQDRPVSARNADDGPANDVVAEESPAEDETSRVSGVPVPSARKLKIQRKRDAHKTSESPTGSETAGARRRFARKEQADNTITAAEKLLGLVRGLHDPVQTRDDGVFTEDEGELLRRAISDYQERHGLDVMELVAIIQFKNPVRDPTRRRKASELTPEELKEVEKSRAFWEDMKQTGLTRPFSKIKGHIRAKYHAYKTGAWTEEEDQEVKDLIELHGRKWNLISSLITVKRSPQDITNRWKDYLQFNNRKVGKWSVDEEESLLNAITVITQRDEDERAQNGQPPLPEYTNLDIDWPQVCKEMGDIRSRLQCQTHWTGMKNSGSPPTIVLSYQPGRTPGPNQVVERTKKKRESRKLPSLVDETPRKRRRLRKSDAAASDSTPASRKRRKTQERKTEEEEEEGDDLEEKGIIPEQETESDKAENAPEDDDLQSLDTDTEQREDGDVSQDIATEPVRVRSTSAESESNHTSDTGSEAVNQRRSGRNGVAQMRWGDKFDLLYAVAEGQPEHEEDIDWHSVSAAMNQRWSIRTLQTALKDLLELVTDQGSLWATTVEIVEYLYKHISDEEIDDRYDSSQAQEQNERAESVDQRNNLDDDSMEIQDGIEPSETPSPKKKRKHDARDSPPQPRETSKKKKMKAVHSPLY